MGLLDTLRSLLRGAPAQPSATPQPTPAPQPIPATSRPAVRVTVRAEVDTTAHESAYLSQDDYALLLQPTPRSAAPPPHPT